GDDAGVRAVGRLTGAEDVEVAEADALQRVAAGPGGDGFFPGELAGRVGGEGVGAHGLDLGERGGVAAGGGGGGVDEAADAGGARGLEDADGAGGVDLERAFGFLDGAGDARHRGEVEDDVGALDGLGEG